MARGNAALLCSDGRSPLSKKNREAGLTLMHSPGIECLSFVKKRNRLPDIFTRDIAILIRCERRTPDSQIDSAHLRTEAIYGGRGARNAPPEIAGRYLLIIRSDILVSRHAEKDACIFSFFTIPSTFPLEDW